VKTCFFLCGKAAFGFARPAFGCPAAFSLVPVQSAKRAGGACLFWGKGNKNPPLSAPTAIVQTGRILRWVSRFDGWVRHVMMAQAFVVPSLS
jgi:hypothetical protein